MPTPIAIAVVEHEGNFLIGQRPAGSALAGYWEFPGGKIEPGETPEAAAVRECLEEAGVAVEALFRYPTHIEEYEHGSVELHFIGCKVCLLGDIEPRQPFRWVRREELDDYRFPAGNRGILQQLASIGQVGPGTQYQVPSTEYAVRKQSAAHGEPQIAPHPKSL